MYINCGMLKCMQIAYKTNKNNLLGREYKSIFTDNTGTNCLNSMHLNDDHGGQDNFSFLRKAPRVRKLDNSNTFCKRNVSR